MLTLGEILKVCTDACTYAQPEFGNREKMIYFPNSFRSVRDGQAWETVPLGWWGNREEILDWTDHRLACRTKYGVWHLQADIHTERDSEETWSHHTTVCGREINADYSNQWAAMVIRADGSGRGRCKSCPW